MLLYGRPAEQASAYSASLAACHCVFVLVLSYVMFVWQIKSFFYVSLWSWCWRAWGPVQC